MASTQDQISDFRARLANAGQNIKRPGTKVAAASPSPAPQASSSSKHDLKRKRPEASNIVYSQPADTGTGQYIMTQVTYAVDYLRTKGTPQKLDDLLSYLSLQHKEAEYLEAIKRILQGHGKVMCNPKAFDGKGSYAFRPKHNIKSGDQLLSFLQKQTTAQGLPVKDLSEGWPEAEEVIRQLENEHKLLVIRNKKDDHARMVWPDDPTLAQNIDPEFQSIWTKIKLPDPETLRTELEKSGLLPANKSQAPKSKTKAPEKKTKKARKSGKTTNTHMLGILRDYSHLKK